MKWANMHLGGVKGFHLVGSHIISMIPHVFPTFPCVLPIAPHFIPYLLPKVALSQCQFWARDIG